MKKRYVTLTIALLTAVVLVLGGCGGSGNGSSASSVESDSFVGTWQLTQEEGVDNADLKADDDSGYAVFLILQDDGTALYEYLGDYYKGDFKEQGNGQASLDLKRANLGETMQLVGGVLKLQRSNGAELEFKKIDDAERGAYDEKFGYDPHVLTGGENGTIENEMDTVLVDDEFCKITVTSALETASTAGYNLEVVNKTDSRLDVRSAADSITIGGETATGNFSVELTPNATESGYLSFYTPDLGGGLEKLKDLKFQLEVIQLPGAETVATYDLEL